MKRVTHDPALMAATLVCGIFLASAPVVHADFVVLKDGTRVDAEMINYNAGRKEYALTDEIGAVIRKSAKAVIEISVAPPPGLDRAAGMLKDPANFETLVPVLQKVVEEYRGRKWDIEAAGYLVEVYLKQGKTKDAITISEEVFAHSQPRWVPAAYSRQYLHLLVKDGQTAAVRKRVDKMLLSNHAPTMAIACLVRGDVLMTEGKFKEALLEGYFRTALIYRDVRSVQAEALSKIVKCLEGLRDPRSDKMRQRLIERYPNSRWANEFGG